MYMHSTDGNSDLMVNTTDADGKIYLNGVDVLGRIEQLEQVVAELQRTISPPLPPPTLPPPLPPHSPPVSPPLPPLPPPGLPMDGSCYSMDSTPADGGYNSCTHGWYDLQGCGKCYEYCRWVGAGCDGSAGFFTCASNSPLLGDAWRTQGSMGGFSAPKCAGGRGSSV